MNRATLPTNPFRVAVSSLTLAVANGERCPWNPTGHRGKCCTHFQETSMEPQYQNQPRDNSKAMDYVKSLKDAVKRRFAGDYLKWIRSGRVGTAPARGALSQTNWRTICTNIDSLA